MTDQERFDNFLEADAARERMAWMLDVTQNGTAEQRQEAFDRLYPREAAHGQG